MDLNCHTALKPSTVKTQVKQKVKDQTGPGNGKDAGRCPGIRTGREAEEKDEQRVSQMHVVDEYNVGWRTWGLYGPKTLAGVVVDQLSQVPQSPDVCFT